jgi:hypothetical protein
VIFPTFRKYIPPPSSGSKCVRLVRLPVYIGSCFEKQKRWGGTVGIGASSAPLRRVDWGNCVFDPCKGSGMHRESHQQLMLCGGHSSTCPGCVHHGELVTKALTSSVEIRSIPLVFTCRWEIQALCVRKVDCRKYAVPWLFILSQMNPVHSLPSYCFKIWFCIILSLTFSSPNGIVCLISRFEIYSNLFYLSSSCGGVFKYLHRSPASHRRRRKGNSVPGGITGTPCHWGP